MISFDTDCGFELDQADDVAAWMQSIAHHYEREVRFVDVVFRSDESIHAMNKEHLQHDYPTDILTFDYSTPGDAIEAELHIGIDEVRRNAEEHQVPFIDELHRVLAHGLLHVCGFNDKTNNEKALMRKAEDLMLGMRMF